MIGKTTRVLREKLQDCHGDTMVEVLAAVFIAALGAAEASLFDSSVPLQEVFVTIPDSEEATRIKVNVYQSGGYAYYEEGR